MVFLVKRRLQTCPHEHNDAFGSKGTIQTGFDEVWFTLGIDSHIIETVVSASKGLVAAFDHVLQLCTKYLINVCRALPVNRSKCCRHPTIIGGEFLLRCPDWLLLIQKILDARKHL
jgi:hypothetical protein